VEFSSSGLSELSEDCARVAIAAIILATTAAMWPLPADLDLRHTFGTYAAQSGANAFLVSPAPSV
jgi:hypothetical protein